MCQTHRQASLEKTGAIISTKLKETKRKKISFNREIENSKRYTDRL